MFVTMFLKCTFPNALECLNEKKQVLKNSFNDEKKNKTKEFNFTLLTNTEN